MTTKVLVYTSDIAVAVALMQRSDWDAVVASDPDSLASALQDHPTMLVLDARDLDRYAAGLVSMWLALGGVRANAEDEVPSGPDVVILSDASTGPDDECALRALEGVTWVERQQFLERTSSSRTASDTADATGDANVRVVEVGNDRQHGRAPNPDHYGSHLVVVVGPKGGVGKTFVACNVAHLLADCMGGDRVLLIDLDLYASDAAPALNLFTGPSINDLLPYSGALNAELVRSKCRRSPAGLHVLAGPERPELADLVTSGFVRELVAVCRQAFTYVVVDTPPDPGNELLYDLLELASRRIIVGRPTSLSLRQLRQFLELVARLELGSEDKNDVVINMHSDESLISLQGIRDLLGRPVHVLGRSDNLVERSVFEGVPLVESAPNHCIARKLREIVGQFSPVAQARQDVSRWWNVPKAFRCLLARIRNR